MWFDKLKWIKNVSKGLLENQEILIDIKNEVWKIQHELQNEPTNENKWKKEDLYKIFRYWKWWTKLWLLDVNSVWNLKNENWIRFKFDTKDWKELIAHSYYDKTSKKYCYEIEWTEFKEYSIESKPDLDFELWKRLVLSNFIWWDASSIESKDWRKLSHIKEWFKWDNLTEEETIKEKERLKKLSEISQKKFDEKNKPIFNTINEKKSLKDEENAYRKEREEYREKKEKENEKIQEAYRKEKEEKDKKNIESWINLWFDKSKDLIKNKILGEVWNSRYYQDVGLIQKTDFWYTIEIVGESIENFWNYISWDNKQRVSHCAELYFDKNFKTIKNKNWDIFGLNRSISMNKFWNYVEITNVNVGGWGRSNYQRACFFYDKNFKLLFDWIASADTEYEVKDWLIKINLTTHSYYTETPSSSFTFIQPILWSSKTWVVFLLEKTHKKAFDDIKPSKRNNYSSSQHVESYEILKDWQYLVKLRWWIYYLYQTLDSKWKLLELSDLATLLN